MGWRGTSNPLLLEISKRHGVPKSHGGSEVSDRKGANGTDDVTKIFLEALMLAHLTKACLVGAFSLFAPAQGLDQTSPPPVERVESFFVGPIESKSLPFNSHAARLVVSLPSEVDEAELINPYVDSNGVFSHSQIGILRRSRLDVTPEKFVRDVNAMRILAFMTQPGERITFNLKSEGSKVRLAVYPDPKMTRVKAAIKKANHPPHAARSSKLIFTNTSKEPYEMLLFVYGLHGYEYQLTWERKSK